MQIRDKGPETLADHRIRPSMQKYSQKNLKKKIAHRKLRKPPQKVAYRWQLGAFTYFQIFDIWWSSLDIMDDFKLISRTAIFHLGEINNIMIFSFVKNFFFSLFLVCYYISNYKKKYFKFFFSKLKMITHDLNHVLMFYCAHNQMYRQSAFRVLVMYSFDYMFSVAGIANTC